MGKSLTCLTLLVLLALLVHLKSCHDVHDVQAGASMPRQLSSDSRALTTLTALSTVTAAQALSTVTASQALSSVTAAQASSNVTAAPGPRTAPRKPLTTIAIVGERHSGTNFMKRTMEVNVRARISDYFCMFKHDYQAPTFKGCPPLDETLVIVMLRNPYDWALAMHRYCWCGGPMAARKMSSLSLKDFLSQPFPEGSIKPWNGEVEKSGCGTLMQCRAIKYLNYLNISSWAPNVVYVHHEEVITPARADAWLQDIMERYGLQPRNASGFQHVTNYKGYQPVKFEYDKAMQKSLWFGRNQLFTNQTVREQVELITGLMDLEVERMVGYAPLVAGPPQALAAALQRNLQPS